MCFTKEQQPQLNLQEEPDDTDFKGLYESMMNLPTLGDPNYEIPFFFLYMKGKGMALGTHPKAHGPPLIHKIQLITNGIQITPLS